MSRRPSSLRKVWRPLAWLVLLALLPWWLGLPLLISLAGVALLLQARLRASELRRLRRALRWGLPGFLIAFVYGFGADALAWVMVLVAALAGFTLIAGIEAWLDRELRRSPEPPDDAEWPELARAPVGPPARIIELQPPRWSTLSRSVGLPDPRGGQLIWHDASVQFADGSVIEDVGCEVGFSPDGQWFFARVHSHRGIVLWDRQHDRRERMPGWDLCGWHDGQPWIMRADDGAPQPL